MPEKRPAPPEMRIRLLLARHGESELNRDGLFYGRLDPALTERGKEQAQALAEQLIGLPIAAIYSSPLMRARQTAEIIGRHLQQPINSHDGLKEQDFGTWEGKSPADLIGPDREKWRRWVARNSYHPAGGESLATVAARGLQWVAEAQAAHPSQTVLAVAHAGWVAALLNGLLGIQQSGFWPMRLRPGQLCDVALFPEGPLLLSLNGPPERHWPPG